mmetsp:Transcript_25936/g.87535  ORF Transcript_25936/g.87535 Transcript_25936/m.87535 type:complete len:382 (-) Transcript_25936:54-1199(-)
MPTPTTATESSSRTAGLSGSVPAHGCGRDDASIRQSGSRAGASAEVLQRRHLRLACLGLHLVPRDGECVPLEHARREEDAERRRQGVDFVRREQTRDAVVHRRARAENEGRNARDHCPDVDLEAIPVRSLLVCDAERLLQPDGEEDLVAEVGGGVDRLGEQRRRARADPARELDARDARVADDRGEDGARPDVDVARSLPDRPQQHQHRRLSPRHSPVPLCAPLLQRRLEELRGAPLAQGGVLHVKDDVEARVARRAVHVVLRDERQPSEVSLAQVVLLVRLVRRERLPLLRVPKLLHAPLLALLPPLHRAHVRLRPARLPPPRRRCTGPLPPRRRAQRPHSRPSKLHVRPRHHRRQPLRAGGARKRARCCLQRTAAAPSA